MNKCGGFGLYFKRKLSEDRNIDHSQYFRQNKISPGIEPLGNFSVIVVLVLWRSKFANSKLLFNIDNMPVVKVIYQS